MISYQAPNPDQKSSWWARFLSSSSRSASTFSSSSIGELILPAQARAAHKADQAKLAVLAQRYSLIIRAGFIQTHDDAKLETLSISPQSEASLAPDQRYYIVKFNGNGGFYQDQTNSYAQEAIELAITIIGFNYRGVGNSQKAPQTFQELVTDGIAQVQRLLDEGADAKKITLDGISLGGAVATMVASHFHKKSLRVSLWNDRSLATLSKAAAGMLAPSLPGLMHDVFFGTLACSSYSIMAPTGWHADIAQAYNFIPAEYKSYMVVAERSEHSTGDGVIAYRASLHIGVSLDEKKKGINTSNIVYAYKEEGGHNVLRSKLIFADNPAITGQTLYERFVLRNRNLLNLNSAQASASAYSL